MTLTGQAGEAYEAPSVLGLRKAEEFNLEFFDDGGIPPVMVLLQGGVLATETRRALEQRTAGTIAAKPIASW